MFLRAVRMAFGSLRMMRVGVTPAMSFCMICFGIGAVGRMLMFGVFGGFVVVGVATQQRFQAASRNSRQPKRHGPAAIMRRASGSFGWRRVMRSVHYLSMSMVV